VSSRNYSCDGKFLTVVRVYHNVKENERRCCCCSLPAYMAAALFFMKHEHVYAISKSIKNNNQMIIEEVKETLLFWWWVATWKKRISLWGEIACALVDNIKNAATRLCNRII
jgi:hypothetical protein